MTPDDWRWAVVACLAPFVIVVVMMLVSWFTAGIL